jgi:hypothetical protein
LARSYVVIDGSWQLTLDDTLVDVGSSDASGWRRRSPGAFRPGPDGLDVIGVGGRRPEGGDGFWG